MPPNELCLPNGRRPARRALLIFLALPFFLILGWLGWEQWQLMKRQAAAPVVSVAEDGRVRVNGHLLEITAEGLPGPGFAQMDGGTPVEMPTDAEYVRSAIMWVRKWHCPRAGVQVVIHRHGEERGVVNYLGSLNLGDQSYSFPATLEFRGQRWWLGPPGPLGALTQRPMLAAVREGDEGAFAGNSSWSLKPGARYLYLNFAWIAPLKWMHGRLPGSFRLDHAMVSLNEVKAGTVAEKGDKW